MPTATELEPVGWTAPWLTAARRRLRAWYTRSARDLPWRRTRDPYRVWISEIMLQQTQVSTVERYFSRFVRAFPTVERLAAAPEDQVLRLWEGLGYYRRARQMHATAKSVVEQHGGRFPSDLEALRRLPGIGRYTAGAIGSIAFGVRAPILEANTTRLMCRLLGYRGDPRSSSGQRLLWQAAERILPRRSIGHFNQALMELGSQVCKPRNPQCDECPLFGLCPTRAQEAQNQIPAATKRPRVESVHHAAVIVMRRNSILLRQCQPGERWAGLWDFPRFSLATVGRHSIEMQVRSGVAQLAGIAVARPRHLVTLQHTVTRFRITLDAFVADYTSARRENGQASVRWVKPHDLQNYPLNVTGRKIARLWQAQLVERSAG